MRTVAGLDGIWVRQGRSIEGSGPEEPALVHWLQAGPYFADIRYPHGAQPSDHWLDQAQGFSGRTTLEDRMVTWSHDLDTVARDGHDVAAIERSGDRLVERGAGYEEYWRQRAAEDAALIVAELGKGGRPGDESVRARIVGVGNLAVAVWAAKPAEVAEPAEPAGPAGLAEPAEPAGLAELAGAALLVRQERWSPIHVVGGSGRLTEVIDALHALEGEGEGAFDGRWRRVL